ncbi:hypothetical protein Y032_0272g929 [Ancylostoma ceylanicum]|nr:hypothetical protein Y032_0272g929 [Ancylostoma ceylanicum]
MSPIWIDECAGVFLACFTEKDEILRASASQSLAELILACRGRNVEKYINEIFLVVERVISFDDSALVRRAAVNLLRQIIRSCDAKIFEVLLFSTLVIWLSNEKHISRSLVHGYGICIESSFVYGALILIMSCDYMRSWLWRR